MNDLTNETEKAFKIIYCEYKARRRSGISKEQAIKFADGTIESLPAFKNWLKEDIKYAIKELIASKFLKPDINGNVTMTDDSIKYMDSKPKEFFEELSKVFDIASLFI